MDYTEQQRFLRFSRIWGIAFIVALVAVATLCLKLSAPLPAGPLGIAVLLVLTLATLVYYTPDYLHLTVNTDKRSRWAVKIRRRLIAAVLVLGLLLASSGHGRIVALLAAFWLLAVSFLARKLPARYTALCFWTTDFALIAALLLTTPLDLTLGAVLLALSAFHAMVTSERHLASWAAFVTALSLALLVGAALGRGIAPIPVSALAALVVVTVGATSWLVYRAARQNAKSVQAALRELMDFTGYSADRVRHLWAVSSQELARNWQAAGNLTGDPDRLAEWYRQNSEVYLFDTSAYNLEYKRIRSNLNVLRLARGSCLDYGAGNGEILLELARRGHRVAYYDVEGETMRFARHRAKQRNLPVQFFTTRDQIAAKGRDYDTIYSLDVLEHLPDLRGELDFLSSLLNPGGLFVFDVPAGATSSHPMYLNHNLDVVTHLKSRGLRDERTFWQRLPFRKEEKYFFRAPSSADRQTSPSTGSYARA
ncbi:MAG TPA: class I SAM-dependent methyltransferase [Candidatus Limnocylindrales bacterium]|nr:class I SAM-dependent methyltransferase [Candidatus Limnocylindrales bacterium]